jgi:hypothetical protein
MDLSDGEESMQVDSNDEMDTSLHQKKSKKSVNTAKQSLTSKMLARWSEQLQSDKPFDAINQVVKAFRAALTSVQPTADKDDDFKVEGSDSESFLENLFFS